jgi:hypothetical protein
MALQKKSIGTIERYHTFTVSVDFKIQFTFTEKDVELSEEGGEDNIDPTDKALAELEQEITEYLSNNYVVSGVNAYADFDSLLGTDEVVKPSKISPKIKTSVRKKRPQKITRPRTAK